MILTIKNIDLWTKFNALGSDAKTHALCQGRFVLTVGTERQMRELLDARGNAGPDVYRDERVMPLSGVTVDFE